MKKKQRKILSKPLDLKKINDESPCRPTELCERLEYLRLWREYSSRSKVIVN